MCNCPDTATADRLAARLIEARLAACVNRLAAVQSVYRWEGKIETASEVPLLIKTTQERYPALEAWLAAEHPYDVPEIIALPLAATLPAYLDWVVQETLPE
ncbi:divalent cation tolerance protein [Formivibrio citricus]|uniref:Divalent cation tolerance protein n=1 Tax=Formivibrio citricus TaxID=83765 RepID=A0A1I5D1B3_9NEIS|nr:divalent cation tolerance protein [Formivibrio citricus]